MILYLHLIFISSRSIRALYSLLPLSFPSKQRNCFNNCFYRDKVKATRPSALKSSTKQQKYMKKQTNSNPLKNSPPNIFVIIQPIRFCKQKALPTAAKLTPSSRWAAEDHQSSLGSVLTSTKT